MNQFSNSLQCFPKELVAADSFKDKKNDTIDAQKI